MGLKTALVGSYLPCSSWNNSKFFSKELAPGCEALDEDSVGFNAACLTGANCEIESACGDQLLHLLLDCVVLRFIPSLEGVNIHETESSALWIWFDHFSEDGVKNLMHLVLMLIILILLSQSVRIWHQMNSNRNLRMRSLNLNLWVDVIRPFFCLFFSFGERFCSSFCEISFMVILFAGWLLWLWFCAWLSW